MYDIPGEPRHRCTVGDQGNVPRGVLLWLLQVFGAVAAVIFGAFTILGWKISEQAISQSNIANMVAFLSFCSDLADKEQDTNLVRGSQKKSLRSTNSSCLDLCIQRMRKTCHHCGAQATSVCHRRAPYSARRVWDERTSRSRCRSQNWHQWWDRMSVACDSNHGPNILEL